MVLPKSLQIYEGGSALHGKYGNPFDFRVGVSYFPSHDRVVRWNAEGLYLYRSPVGNTSLPYLVGSKGFVFHTNVEVAF